MGELNQLMGLPIPGSFKHVKKYKLEHTTKPPETFKEAVLYTGSFFEYYDFCKQKSEHAKRAHYSENRRVFDNRLFEDRGNDAWTGGNYDGLCAPIKDLSGYEKTRKEISQSKLWKEVATKMGQTSVRKRVRSAHDGELDFDKIFDVEPFTNRARKESPVKIVKMFVECSFSAHVTAKTIENYGSFVSSVINLMESNGTGCEVSVTYTSRNAMTGSAGNDTMQRIELMVKRADQYLPISQLLKVFSPVFFRRAIFGLTAACAEFSKKTVCESMGQPIQRGTCWEIKDKNLYLYSVPNFADQESIIKKLMQVVGV